MFPLGIPSYWAALDVSSADTGDLPKSVGLYVTGAGDVAFVGNGGTTVTVTAVAAKSYLWCDVRKVLHTGTSATGLFLMVR